MAPSPEEIKKGRDAFRRIGTYETRWQRIKGSYIRSGLLGLLFAFCIFKMGGEGAALLIVTFLWVLPKIIIGCMLKWQQKRDISTLQVLREKYGSSIDSELEQQTATAK